MASSIATSPPQTTTTSLPLKKKPSHVAQADTPLPFSLVSDSRPSHMTDEPVAIIVCEVGTKFQFFYFVITLINLER
jgi:hypothetical protein